jgi:hypothetical protein
MYLIANGIIIRIIVVDILAFCDIETSINISTMIIIKAVKSIPNNFLKFTCDISWPQITNLQHLLDKTEYNMDNKHECR